MLNNKSQHIHIYSITTHVAVAKQNPMSIVNMYIIRKKCWNIIILYVNHLGVIIRQNTAHTIMFKSMKINIAWNVSTLQKIYRQYLINKPVAASISWLSKSYLEKKTKVPSQLIYDDSNTDEHNTDGVFTTDIVFLFCYSWVISLYY